MEALTAQRLRQAQALHQQGQLDRAEPLYRAVLAAAPGHFSALHLLGILCAQTGRNDEALALIGRALAIQPRDAGALVHYGNVLNGLGRFAEALAAYDKALAIAPRDPATLNNRGSALLNLGRAVEALAAFDQALALAPDHPDALFNSGNALRALGRASDAVARYDRLLARAPRHAEALYNRGNALWEMGQAAQALESHKAVLALEPRHAGAWNNLGIALERLGRFEDALGAYDRALAVKGDFVEAWNNRANLLTRLRQFDEALASYDRSLAIAPGRPGPMQARAGLLLRLKRYREALAAYDALGEPDNRYVLGGLATAAMNLCDWGRMAELAPRIDRDIRSGACVFPPFLLLGHSDDKSLQLAAGRNAAADAVPAGIAAMTHPAPGPRERLRIGYLSSDYCQHPVPMLIARLIEAHDRNGFEIHGLSTGMSDASAARARIEKAFDHFHDLQRLDAAAVAQRIAALGIDILVDLNGHTEGDSFAILARRPAPLQVSYLGFPATTGADFLDYVLTDSVIAPAADQPFFSERIVELPACYFPTSYAPAGPPPSRAACGLPEKDFVFACFNNSWKFTEEMFSAWMRLLAAVPGSVLWLLAAHPELRATLEREAAARGIDPARLVFAARATPEQHLARQALADLMLDTFPYNGHMTSADALWVGVPLVTRKAEDFAGRVGASLLRDVPELITGTLADYEALALALARDPARLRALREKLAWERPRIFDIDPLRRAVEAACRAIWEVYANGEAPRTLRVAP